MKKLSLCGEWTMTGGGYTAKGNVPGSVYSFLLGNGLTPDPFYRDNEDLYVEISKNEFEFSRRFDFDGAAGQRVLLVAEGLDTLCELYLNGQKIAYTDNMHRTYEFDVTDALRVGENEITAKFLPVQEYMNEKDKEYRLLRFESTFQGFTYVRKAHCMLGWDWGPMLPDAGIWRDIYLLVKDSARITDVHITQRHEGGRVFVTPSVKVDTGADIRVKVTTPKGETYEIGANRESEIKDAMLWRPNGLGEQNLYTFDVEICEGGRVCDSVRKRIGLRTLELVQEADEYGRSFYHRVNGVPFFAMGGDYIPEDNILSRVMPERSRKLLTHCRNSNFNAIRVWGGGYYPDDWFFDICDELGLVVFLDLMFACVMIPYDDEFVAGVKIEVEQNLRRLRHHASLAIVSGNNEIEQIYYSTKDDKLREAYIRIFEHEIKDLEAAVCPEIPYISSSPSSGGSFIDTFNENYGDSHYWSVWHGNLPFTEYRKHYFRYLSEFGFQSFPSEKTIESFTLPEDRNVFSRIMEKHQRNGMANGKILNYLSATFKYPSTLGNLVYASQLMQAEAMRYGVEHLRRNRGRCMGALYWQINDIYPAASWASIDSYGRLKALQYFAKRFFAPVMVNCEEVGESTTRPFITLEKTTYDYATTARIAVCNETFDRVEGKVRYALRSSDAKVIECGEEDITIEPFSTTFLDTLDFHKTDVKNNYLSYEFVRGGEVVSSGTVLFTYPKHFDFISPNLRYEIAGDEITVYADAYAKYVEIDSPDCDLVLSDNYFDMNGGAKTVKILEGSPKTLKLRSVYDIER